MYLADPHALVFPINSTEGDERKETQKEKRGRGVSTLIPLHLSLSLLSDLPVTQSHPLCAGWFDSCLLRFLFHLCDTQKPGPLTNKTNTEKPLSPTKQTQRSPSHQQNKHREAPLTNKTNTEKPLSPTKQRQQQTLKQHVDQKATASRRKASASRSGDPWMDSAFPGRVIF